MIRLNIIFNQYKYMVMMIKWESLWRLCLPFNCNLNILLNYLLHSSYVRMANRLQLATYMIRSYYVWESTYYFKCKFNTYL